VEKFVDEECIPADAVFAQQLGTDIEARFSAHPAIMEELKSKAKALGLWNMFLPRNHFKEGAGFSNLEYGLMAEMLGKSATASEVCLDARQTGMKSIWTNAGNTGYQLRRTGHRQHGGHCQVRHRSTEEEVARPSTGRQDSICVFDD
jgi:acyl-CoA dehydrogenase